MSSTQDVVFVLVPGSFATPEMHSKVSDLLQKEGHSFKDVALLSANDGSRQPQPKMEDDAAEIRSAIVSILDEGKNVVLAVQSYGGIPGTEAVKGLSKIDRANNTAVIGILYVASFIPSVGQSLRDIVADIDTVQEPYKSGIPGGHFPPIAPEMAGFVFNDVTDPAEISKYSNAFTGHSSDSYGGKVTYAASKDIPGTQLIPEKDVIIEVQLQEKMYKDAVANGAKLKRVWVPGAGHALAVSQPRIIVDELVKLATQ